jgi:multiple sugar transport system substrate-binding protein
MNNKTQRPFVLATSLGAGALAIALAGCSVTGGSSAGDSGDGSGVVSALVMQQAGYTEEDYAEIIEQFESAHPDITVEPTFVSYEALHDKIVTSAPAGTYDVVMIDVIWPAEFASTGIIADITDRIPESWSEEMFPGVLTTAEYRDRYYGVPLGPATKFFNYNTDMVEAVGATEEDLATWDGVLDVARKIKAAGISEYPIAWSWSQSEALICDYAQLLGAFGGEFTDEDGQLIINNEAGVETLEWMKATLDEGLSNPASTTFLEDGVLKALAQGETAFGLLWDAMLRDVRDPEISTIADASGVLPTPAGPSGERPGVNGSMAYSVAATSDNQDAAWEFVEFITSQTTQDQFVESTMPSWKSTYENEELIAANPDLFEVASVAYETSVLRPTVPNYPSVSQIIQVELQNALLGAKTPQQAMDDAVAAANATLED